MKKFIAGIVVGAILFGAVPTFAESLKSLVGTKVTGVYSVEQSGKKIAEGAVINGSAYVPVRAMAEATGVGLKVEGRVITLDEVSGTSANLPAPEGNALSAEALVWTNQINRLKGDINGYNVNILAENAGIKEYEDAIAAEKAKAEPNQSRIDAISKNLAASRATVADYESKITAAEAEIARLQALIDADK